VGTFGERLQREREMRGITLEEISGATKISTRSLRALELQEFDKLPGGVFNKGFVRAYSRYLGIDEEQAVADYVSAASEAETAGRDPQRSESSASKLGMTAGMDRGRDWRRVWGVLLVAAVLAGLGVGGWLLYTRGPSPLKWARGVLSRHPSSLWHASAALPSAPSPAAGAQAQRAGGAANPASGTAPAGSDPQPNEFVVQVRGRHRSHLAVRADGQEVMNGTLIGADVKPFRARQQVVITAENPSAVQYSFNGKPFRLLGSGRQEETLIFTADGMQR